MNFPAAIRHGRRDGMAMEKPMKAPQTEPRGTERERRRSRQRSKAESSRKEPRHREPRAGRGVIGVFAAMR